MTDSMITTAMLEVTAAEWATLLPAQTVPYFIVCPKWV